MERTVTQARVAPIPSPQLGIGLALPDLSRLKPLWRYAVFTLCLFAVTAFAVAIRLDVQQMRKDLDRNARAHREARILNDRLHLEMDSRRRAAAMEVVATRLELGTDARIVSVRPVAP